LFDQTPGTMGLFESLSYSSQSLFGVQWWGVPFYELGLGFLALACAVEVVIRLWRSETFLARQLCEGLAHQVGYFGVWVFVFSGLANLRHGEGIPRMILLRPERTWVGLLALLVLVDAAYYWEHRTRLLVWTRIERQMPFVRWRSKTNGTHVSVGSLLWTMVFLIAMACFGFDLLWLVGLRMLITLYQSVIHLSWLPRLPWKGWLFMGRSKPRMAGSLETQTDLGGMFRVWDRLFDTAGSKGQR
jgi:hypothetical protein